MNVDSAHGQRIQANEKGYLVVKMLQADCIAITRQCTIATDSGSHAMVTENLAPHEVPISCMWGRCEVYVFTWIPPWKNSSSLSSFSGGQKRWNEPADQRDPIWCVLTEKGMVPNDERYPLRNRYHTCNPTCALCSTYLLVHSPQWDDTCALKSVLPTSAHF